MRVKVIRNKVKMIAGTAMAFVLALGMPLNVQARYFSDVSAYSQEYKDAMSFVADNGYMNGTYTNMFSPASTMTRAMYVTVLYNMAGRPDVTNTIPFPDVASNAWYYDPVRWAYGVGLVSGSGNGNFSPNSAISKQDASLILYKYAVGNGLAVDKQDSLDEYSDKNSVSSYALTAVKWAVAIGIYPNGDADTLTPTTSFPRANMAMMITRFGTNVEYIVFGRDNYQFANSSSVFSSTYYVEQEQFNKLKNCILINWPNKAEGLISQIEGKRNTTWKGSCYGMALTSILDKLGKIDLNGNFATDAKTMYDVQLQSGNEIESAINYYHLSQYIPMLRENSANYAEYEWGDQLQYAVDNLIENKGESLFLYQIEGVYGYPIGGHAIVAYDIKQTYDNLYEVSAYDNRYPDNLITIKIDTLQKTCYIYTPNGYEKACYVEVCNDFAAHDAIDIDDDLNVNTEYGVADDDVEILYIDLNGDFEVNNAEGQSLMWSDCHLHGDMKIISSSLVINGSDVPSTLVLVVEPSENFTITSLMEGAELKVDIVDKNGYTSMEGVIDEEIHIDNLNHTMYSGNALY
ncbi:MAG: S-layer homology domain-containing protein [Lachnospiraceae bacterium]|nr:S-layer homology domain-containing protein [Lachnospiraceae bacterium]